MDARVAALKTLKDCERFAKNVLDRNRPDLAQKAHKRTLELRAEAYGAVNLAERDCLAAVYAYEEVLAVRKGRKTRASNVWYAIKKFGVVAAVDRTVNAVERAVNREADKADYFALRSIGLEDCAFEAVVMRHPGLFSSDTVQLSAKRLGRWKHPKHASQLPA